MKKYITIGVEVETEEDYELAIQDLTERTTEGICGTKEGGVWVEDAEKW